MVVVVVVVDQLKRKKPPKKAKEVYHTTKEVGWEVLLPIASRKPKNIKRR